MVYCGETQSIDKKWWTFKKGPSPHIKLREHISWGNNMNCVEQNALCYNNIQSRSSLDLLLSHLLSVLFSLQCIILQTEITLIISCSRFVLRIYVCFGRVCLLASTRQPGFSVFICQYQFLNSPARWVQWRKSLLGCLFHLLVIHNNFRDGEIIAHKLAAISKKMTGNKHQIMMKRATN